MRKLIWCGVTGLAIVAGGYNALCHPGARSGSAICPQVVPSCCEAGSVQGCAEEFEHCDLVSEESELGLCKPLGQVPVSQAEPGPLSSVINLTGSSSYSPPAIFIPDGEEPPLTPPAEVTEASLMPTPPRIMPYCDDTNQPADWQCASDDPWPAPGTRAMLQAGWFEDAEPADSEEMPAWREDVNLPRQYPGCPFPGGDRPASSGQPKKVVPWKHDKEPILPVLPDGEGIFPLAPGDDDGKFSEFLTHWSNGLSLEATRGATGVRRHTTLKVRVGGDSDRPVRQSVDTLELRPGDIHRDHTAPEPY